jgi:hypothetical protein
MNMFKCIGCHKILSTSGFYKEKSKRGHTHYCRECLKGIRGKWRLEHKDEIEQRRIAYLPQHALNMRGYRQSNPEKHRESNRRYFRMHPERRIGKTPEQEKTHNLFKSALRSGKLRRPLFCEKCGEFGNLQGHHSDYSKPLQVEWLCPRCHARLHKARYSA